MLIRVWSPQLNWSNESIQCEVEKHLAELRTLNESTNKGRVKAQCGGPGDIFVKKSVDWPENFILTGNQKTRPTFDTYYLS